MLACRSLQGYDYRAQLVPGTQIVLIQKFAEYNINLTEEGFQFEEFCVHGQLRAGDINTMKSNIHMQTIAVDNRWNILLSAECDGMDHLGDPVEMKCTTKKQRNEKVAFQMMSAGSLTLYGAHRDKTTLKGLYSVSLKQIIKDVFGSEPNNNKLVGNCEKNLRHGLNALQEAVKAGRFDNGCPLTIQFHNRQLKLHPVSLLPSESVVRELLEPRQK